MRGPAQEIHFRSDRHGDRDRREGQRGLRHRPSHQARLHHHESHHQRAAGAQHRRRRELRTPSSTASSSSAAPAARSGYFRSNTARSLPARICSRTYSWKAAMSSSFPERARGDARARPRVRCSPGARPCWRCGPVLAAVHARGRVLFSRPASLTARGRYQSRSAIRPTETSHPGLSGAVVLLYSALPLRIRTTTIRPRLEYRDYPDDLRTIGSRNIWISAPPSSSQRSSASIYGSLEHRDEFNAELPLRPVRPPACPSRRPRLRPAKRLAGATRDSALVVPNYNFKFSPFCGVGVSGVYQKHRLLPQRLLRRRGFHLLLRARRRRAGARVQQTDISFGGFGSQVRGDPLRLRRHGSRAPRSDLDTNWSPLFRPPLPWSTSTPSHVDTAIPTAFTDSQECLGRHGRRGYKTQVSQYRLDARPADHALRRRVHCSLIDQIQAAIRSRSSPSAGHFTGRCGRAQDPRDHGQRGRGNDRTYVANAWSK